MLPLAAFPATALAMDYFVGLDGSDSRCNGGAPVGDDGSGNCAWKTLQHAVDRVAAGDTVYLLPGIHRVDQVTISANGSARKRITIRGTGMNSIISGAMEVDETLFSRTPGYSSIYEIPYSDLPRRTFDSLRQEVTQLDGTTPWLGYRADGTRIELEANYFQGVTSMSQLDLLPKSYLADDSNQTLYIHTSDGQDPRLHRIEISRPFAHRALTFENASYVTLYKVTLRHAGVFMQGTNNNIEVRYVDAIASSLMTGASMADHDNLVRAVYVHEGLRGVGERVDETTGRVSGGSGCCSLDVAGVRPILQQAIIEEMWNAVSTSRGSLEARIERSFFRDCPNHSTYIDAVNTDLTLLRNHYMRVQDAVYIDGAVGTRVLHNTMEAPVIFQSLKSGIAPVGTLVVNNILTGYAVPTGDPIDPYGGGDVRYVDFFADYNFFLPRGGFNQTGAVEPVAFQPAGGAYTRYGLQEWQSMAAAAGRPHDAHSLEADGSPLFVNWSSDDLRPVEGGITVDAGTPIVTSEFQGVAPDLGADELAGVDPLPGLEPADIWGVIRGERQ
jgi:hypothetical protein